MEHPQDKTPIHHLAVSVHRPDGLAVTCDDCDYGEFIDLAEYPDESIFIEALQAFEEDHNVRVNGGR